MEPELMGSKLAEFVARQHDGSTLSADELRVLVSRLNDLASEVHDLPAGDMQASTAKIDELRRQYAQWLDTAVEQQHTSEPVTTVALLDQEYCAYRDKWLEADGRERNLLEVKIIDCLARVEAKPDSEQLALHIRTFLSKDAGLPGF